MYLTDDEVKRKVATFGHWFHRIELRPGIVTPGPHDSPALLRRLQLPDDCSGMRVLDLGTRDGFFAFEMERRGAVVVALDYFPPTETGFGIATEVLGSRVRYVQDNIYNLRPEKYGHFDIVLLLGMIHHLPDPLLALNLIRSVCKGQLFLETHVIDQCFVLADGRSVPLASISRKLEGVPLMQFYRGNTLNDDNSRFWGPNVACLEQMLAESDFDVLGWEAYGNRAVFQCRTADTQRQLHTNVARGALAVHPYGSPASVR